MDLRPRSRLEALARMERTAALTHLVASAEYLARPADRRPGGLNHWGVSGRAFRARAPRLGRAVDVVSRPRVTAGVHVLRIGAALALQGPLGRRSRLGADATLAATSAALYPRHHYGTDGSDQVSFLVQTVSAAARAAEDRPRVVDAALWYVALQSVLSYAVSGWAKLAGPSWRHGDALEGVTRTLTYGDPTAWRMFRRFPRVARVLGAGVLAMECTFPAVFLARGRFAPPLVLGAAAFHLANARIMGLGRFVWAFLSMHPAVLYASGPREARDARGRVVAVRDDTLPQVCAGLLGSALAAALVAQGRRRGRVLGGRGDEALLEASSGNTLAYRRTGGGDGPVVVLECGLLATAEHWEWIARQLAERLPVVTYARAGYGASRRGADGPYDLAEAVRDLVELVEHVRDGRPAVLVGHSLGGHLALRAAAEAPGAVAGVGLLDSSHPDELRRSSRQAQGQQVLTSSLALMPFSLAAGLGALLERPDWLGKLPDDVQELALAQYRDPRLWAAGRREWEATVRDFEASGEPPAAGVPLLVLTAGYTAANDAVQQELHGELADTAPWAERHVVEGADHDSVLTNARHARRVAALIEAWVDRVASGERDAAAAR